MDDLTPKQVGELKPVSLTDKLIPFIGTQPHFMGVTGSSDLYLPCFDKQEQLEEIMEKVEITEYTIKRIENGAEFLESIPADIKVALNFRILENGKVRWTEIQR